MPNNKILLIVAYSHNYTLRYLVIDPTVPTPTSLKDYRAIEHVLDWSLFSKLDKVGFFKKCSDIICSEVVKATKIENILRESLNKVSELLKDEKWTTKAKHVTIKELDE